MADNLSFSESILSLDKVTVDDSIKEFFESGLYESSDYEKALVAFSRETKDYPIHNSSK